MNDCWVPPTRAARTLIDTRSNLTFNLSAEKLYVLSEISALSVYTSPIASVRYLSYFPEI